MRTLFFFIVILPFFLGSCKKGGIYTVNNLDENGILRLNSWHIIGPVIDPDSTIRTNYLMKEHLACAGLTDSIFCIIPSEMMIPDNRQVKNLFMQTDFHSKDPIIDLNEKKVEYPDIYGSAIYFYCNIDSDTDETVYLLTRSSNAIRVWLNTELLCSSYEGKTFELFFSEFIPLHLKKGNNCLVIKKINLSNEILLETIICKKESMVNKYLETSSELIIYPSIITDNTLFFTRNHSEILNTDLNVCIKNLNGDPVFSDSIKRGISKFSISGLKNNCSYFLYFKVDSFTFSQPFYKGDPDEAYNRFVEKRSALPKNESPLHEIDALLYRLNVLLNHSSRTEDWWWQLKVSSVIYELDNLYQNFFDEIKMNQNSSGIRFKAYISSLDSTLQHYLYIIPQGLAPGEKIPLVVVIRPFTKNHYPLLISPQVARYWSLADAKYLADKYRYAIVMPAGRLYSDEELIPMADAEIIQVIHEVERLGNVDSSRIYLHGNCLGGYRCLSLAWRHPGTFAAIGLYAPIYETQFTNDWVTNHSPQSNIDKIKSIPVKIHYDPLDSHSPYISFKKLVEDCEQKRIELSLSNTKYSGLHYNVLLVGEEAFAFFKGKNKPVSGRSLDLTNNQEYKKVIADLFAQPFIFVYNSSDESKQYKETVDSIRCEYENYLFCKMPLVACENITKRDLLEKNIFFIGHDFNNTEIVDLLSKIPFTVENSQIRIYDKNYKGKNQVFQAVFNNPSTEGKLIVMYSTNSKDKFFHTLSFPWKNSLNDCITQNLW